MAYTWLRTACIPQRFVLAIMGCLAMVNSYTMRTCMAVAITEMVHHHKKNETLHEDPYACPADLSDEQAQSTAGTFDWDEETQGLILSSFFWGYVITHLPGGMLAEKFGGKYSLGLGMLCTAIFTLLTPLAADYGGANWVIAVRIIEGLGEGTTIPALNALLAQWTPPHERSRLGTLVFAGGQIGNVISTALSGALLHYTTWGWPGVFYVFGIAGVLWFIFFILLCYNSPSSHPFISDKEKKYLEDYVGTTDRAQLPPTPWRFILTSVPLWGLICAQIGHDWGLFTLMTDLPKYMKDVMKYNIRENGYLSAIPYLVMWCTAIASSWLADWMIIRNVLSITNTRKLFTTIASVGPSAGIIAASYAGCDRTAVVLLFTVGMALMGTFLPGMKVNALDLSPNYAGTLMALVNGIGAFSGIVTPYLVGVLTPDRTLLQWRRVFWIVVGVFIFTNLIFLLTASGEVQSWNDQTGLRKEEPKTEEDRDKKKTEHAKVVDLPQNSIHNRN